MGCADRLVETGTRALGCVSLERQLDTGPAWPPQASVECQSRKWKVVGGGEIIHEAAVDKSGPSSKAPRRFTAIEAVVASRLPFLFRYSLFRRSAGLGLLGVGRGWIIHGPCLGVEDTAQLGATERR